MTTQQICDINLCNDVWRGERSEMNHTSQYGNGLMLEYICNLEHMLHSFPGSLKYKAQLCHRVFFQNLIGKNYPAIYLCLG